MIVRPVDLQDEIEFFFYQCPVIFLFFHFQVGDSELLFLTTDLVFGIRDEAVLLMFCICLILYSFLSVKNCAAMSFHLISFYSGIDFHETFVVGKSHHIHPFILFFLFPGKDACFVYRQFKR